LLGILHRALRSSKSRGNVLNSVFIDCFLCTNLAISLRGVTLNHTLYAGKYARPGQRVTFTCEARDTSIMEWYSDEYVGSSGDRIEIVRGGDGRNQTRLGGQTVATTVSVTTYSGVTVIVSQLHIMTSEQIPTSSVTCAINGQGPREAVSFITTGMKSCTLCYSWNTRISK
jgi:hypothetical protein